MNRNELKTEANRRLLEIEKIYGERPLPRQVLAYYLLLRATYLGDLEAYQYEYGHQHLKHDVVEEGKESLGWGPLTEFERGICDVLNEQYELSEFGIITNHTKNTPLRY